MFSSVSHHTTTPLLRQDLRITVKRGGKILLNDVTGQITSGYYAIMARAAASPAQRNTSATRKPLVSTSS